MDVRREKRRTFSAIVDDMEVAARQVVDAEVAGIEHKALETALHRRRVPGVGQDRFDVVFVVLNVRIACFVVVSLKMPERGQRLIAARENEVIEPSAKWKNRYLAPVKHDGGIGSMRGDRRVVPRPCKARRRKGSPKPTKNSATDAASDNSRTPAVASFAAAFHTLTIAKITKASGQTGAVAAIR
jgi:hypothetical protein